MLIDTYPDFRIDLNRVADAITPRDQADPAEQPRQPDRRRRPRAEEIRGLGRTGGRHGTWPCCPTRSTAQFCYDEPFVSPAQFNEQTIVIDGFSKSHAMTGWRLGFVHGPAEVIDTMIKLQQYTFVCAPQPAQWAGAVAMDVDISQHIDAYRRKRDMIVDGLVGPVRDRHAGRRVLRVSQSALGHRHRVRRREAIENNLLIIPGNIFSRQRHAFPHLLRRRRRGDRTRHRSAEEAGLRRR